MSREIVELESGYKLISAEAGGFFAQNRSKHVQEWVRSSGFPANTVIGVAIAPGKGVHDGMGTGDLYGRGIGDVGFLY